MELNNKIAALQRLRETILLNIGNIVDGDRNPEEISITSSEVKRQKNTTIRESRGEFI